MQIIIYNPNSKGGNYKYAQYTAKALAAKGNKVTLVLPKNASSNDLSTYQPNNLTTYSPNDLTTYSPILLPDTPKTSNTLLKKLYFFYRIVLNPILFYLFLKKQSSSKIIFNDFDQLTAIFWAPLFKKLKKKHKFSVILHDPDRDAYPGGIKHTNRSMKAILKIMDIAFFHEQLPDKIYYKEFTGNKISIPHGIYPAAPADTELLKKIEAFKNNGKLLCIPGNIRYEKNYQLIIEALSKLKDYKLLIAGSPSSSIVDVKELKELAKIQQVEDRILWLVKYLTDDEFTSVLESSDLILLYYQNSFTSQSGILNQIAPLKKNVLISNTPSALTKLAKEFKLGTLAEADKIEAFIEGVNEAFCDNKYRENWERYLEYASWEKQAKKIVRGLGD